MAMIECTNTEIRDLLPLLLSGRLLPPVRGMVESHLPNCPACRAELELLQTARQCLARAPSIDIGHIVSAIPAYRGLGKGADGGVVSLASRRRAAPAWRIAAGALLVLGAAGTFTVWQTQQDGAPGSVAAADGPRNDAPATDAIAAPSQRPTLAETPASTAGGGNTALPRRGDAPQLSFGGGLEGLSDADLVALLAALDETNVVPSTEPDESPPVMPMDGDEET